MKNISYALSQPQAYLIVKRVMDVVLSGVALAFLSPFLLGIALLIKLESRGPVFFIQRRVGLAGQEFSMFKFRTMVENAEDLKASLSGLNERSGPSFKITNDPRITRVGKFLRKHSLDELPQLINILRGEMSIVGPRPPLAEEVQQYQPWHMQRFNAVPGLTCFWQIDTDRNMDFDRWVSLDLKYIQERNIWLDIKLILKTIPVVVFGQH